MTTLTPEASETKCFTNFRDAISYATEGHVNDAPLTGAEAIRDPSFRQKVGMGYELLTHNNNTSGSGQILSIEYEHRDFRGNTVTYRGAGGCDRDKGIEYALGSVGAHWNDQFSSYATANRCQVKHWEHINQGGASTQWSNGDDAMGAMNDETSSLRWR